MTAFIKVDDEVFNVDRIAMWSAWDNLTSGTEETMLIMAGDTAVYSIDVPADVFEAMVARACSNAERGVFVPVTPEHVLKSETSDKERTGPKAPY